MLHLSRQRCYSIDTAEAIAQLPFAAYILHYLYSQLVFYICTCISDTVVLACPNIAEPGDRGGPNSKDISTTSRYSSRLMSRIADTLPSLQLPSDIKHIQLETIATTASATDTVAAVTAAISTAGAGGDYTAVKQVQALYNTMIAQSKAYVLALTQACNYTSVVLPIASSA
jgi:hypothetical protein